MSAQYKGLEFKTRLEAKWAAFFDLAGWSWWTNPAAIEDWRPDFKVTFTCSHSECNGDHTLLIAVLPTSDLKTFEGHPCLTHSYLVKDAHGKWQADAGAAFGSDPSVTIWEFSHGSGVGIENLDGWVPNAHSLWDQANELIDKY